MRAGLPGVEQLFPEVQKRDAKTPTVHLLFHSLKPTIASQAEPAQGVTAGSHRSDAGCSFLRVAQGPGLFVSPRKYCSGAGQAHSRQPWDISSSSHPKAGPGFSLPPHSPEGRDSLRPKPSQLPALCCTFPASRGWAWRGQSPAYPPLCTQALHCLAHGRFFHELWMIT